MSLLPKIQGVIACCAGLLAASAVAPAEARVPVCRAMDLPVSETEAPPIQYQAFCERNPGHCDLTGDPVMIWTGQLHARLSHLNGRVNADIDLQPDWDNLGVEERWSYPEDCRGDCEDFALEKRRRLVKAGFPSAALTMAIAFHEVQFFPHAVLLAETTAGTWVLDNLQSDLMCWDALPYRYTRRERPDGRWDRFEVR